MKARGRVLSDSCNPDGCANGIYTRENGHADVRPDRSAKRGSRGSVVSDVRVQRDRGLADGCACSPGGAAVRSSGPCNANKARYRPGAEAGAITRLYDAWRGTVEDTRPRVATRMLVEDLGADWSRMLGR